MKLILKLLLFWTVLVVVPAILLALSFFQRQIESEQQQTMQRQLALVRILATALSSDIQEATTVLTAAARSLRAEDGSAPDAQLRQPTYLTSVRFIGRGAKPGHPAVTVKPAGPELISDSVALLSVPVQAPDGYRGATLVGELNLRELTAQIAALARATERLTCYLVDGAGHILSIPTGRHPRLDRTTFESRLVGDENGWADIGQTGDGSLLQVTAPVPATNWRLMSELPLSAAIAPIAGMGKAGIVIVILSFIGMALIGILGSQLLIRPVNQLTIAAKELAEGNFTVRVDISSGDELERVGTVINRTTEWLNAYMELSRAVFQSLDPEDISKRAVEAIHKTSRSRYAAVYLSRTDGRGLRRMAVRSDRPVDTVLFSDEMRARVITGGLPMVEAGLVQIPLAGKDRVLGLLEIASTSGEIFDDGEIKGLEQIARQLALALTNAYLFQQTKKGAEEQAGLFNIARIANQSLKLDAMLDRVLDELLRVTGNEVGSIYLWDADLRALTLRSSKGLPNDTVRKRVVIGRHNPRHHSPLGPGAVSIIRDMRNDPVVNPSVVRLLHLRSSVWIPMQTKHDIIGAVHLASRRIRLSEPSDNRFLTHVGQELSVAIASVLRHRDIQDRLAEFETIQKLGYALAQELDEQRVVRRVTTDAVTLTGATGALISLVLPDRKQRVYRGCVGERISTLEGTVVDIANSGQDRVITRGKPLFSPDTVHDRRLDTERVAKLGIRSSAYVPLMVKGETIGCLCVFSQTAVRAFGEHQCRLLTIFAHQASTAIQNARFFASEKKRSQQLEAMWTVSQETTSILNRDYLLATIAKLIHDRFGLYSTHVLLVEGDEIVCKASAEKSEEMRARFRLPIAGNSIVGIVARTGQPLVVNNVLEDARFLSTEILKDTRSELAVPLSREGRIVGVLDVQSDRRNAFDETDERTFQHIADHVAVLINNAQLYERTTMFRKMTDSAIENLASGLMYVDGEGGLILFNRAMEELLGVPLAGMVGAPPRVLREALGMETCPFQRVLATGTSLVYQEKKFRKADGSRLTVGIGVNPLLDESGKIVGAVGLFIDLTAVKKVEAEQRKFRDKALIGETVTRLAHEIKNPLASILSGIQLLQRRCEPQAAHAGHFEAIVGEIRRLDVSLKELLVFSRAKEPEFSSENPLAPIEHALRLLDAQLGEQQITVTKEFDPAPPRIRMDLQKMEQVIYNLVLNAVQASKKGGAIRVSAQVFADRDRPVLRYEITDSGPGVPEENREKIFDPFFSTKTHGSGLGLTIAQRIVDEHNGTIAFSSAPERGTTFTVELPVEAE